MADERAKSQKKMFYTMGEVAEMFDVNPSLLRFWERKFDIIKPRKTQKGNRQFSQEDIRNIKLVYHLVKERGMTLEGAAKYIKAGRKSIERDMELAERLQSIRSMLLEVRGRLGADGSEVVIADDPADALPAVETIPKPEITPESETIGAPETEGGPLEPIIEQAHEEEVIDVLMDDVIDELYRQPEEMPDFDPSPEPAEPAGPDEADEADAGPREEVEEEPAKPLCIDQTLF